MSARVRLALDESGAVAIKVAHSPEDVVALRYEIALLRRASHPGLVTILDVADTGDGRPELHTRFAGEALTRWRGDLRGAVGLGAAIAATLADLHALGMVHGRIDCSHVLVGADGRPRLCGFAPPGDRAAADDVAALGQVIDDLLDRSTAVEPRWALISRRSAIADRRAVADVLRRATHPDPSRRLPARSFATALLAAVPDATLPRRNPPPPLDASTSSAQPTAADPTGGDQPRPGSSRPVRAPVVDRELADSSTENQASGRPTPTGSSRQADKAGLDDRPVAGPGRTFTAAVGRSAFRRSAESPNEAAVDHPVFGAEGAAAHDPVFGDQTTAELAEVFVDRPWPAPTPLRRPVARRSKTRSGRRRVATAGLVGLGAVAVGAVVIHFGRPPAGGRTAVASIEPAVPGCETTPTATAADIDGDGCVDALRVDRGVVEAGGQRWQVGDAADLVTVADWDCDGLATPALYRPDTGDVFVFPSWASAESPVAVTAVDTIAGGRGLAPAVTGTDNCPQLAVEMPSGEHRAVEVER